MTSHLLMKHFDRISEAAGAVSRLRRFVIELAIRGKLIPQSPSDECVTEQLKHNDRARREKAESDSRADAARQIPLAAQDRWTVPSTWEWSALADTVLFIDYRGQTPVKVEHGVRLLTAKNVKRRFINLMPEEFISERDYGKWMTRGIPQQGDILFTTEAPMGNAAVVELSERFALAQRVICFRPYSALGAEFLVLQLLSDSFRAILDKTATGLTAKGIKAAKLKRLPIVVPPTAEQDRIVAKVGELMALCDRFEAAHAGREKTRNTLVAAASHHLVSASDPAAFRDRAGFYLSNLPRLTTRTLDIARLRETIRNLAVRGRLVPQDPIDDPASQLVSKIATNKTALYAAKKIPKPTQIAPLTASDLPFGIPINWCWTMLGNLCYQVSDGPHFSPKYVGPDEGVAFLSTRNVRLGSFDLSSVKYVSRKDHEEFCKRIRPEKDDIIYTKGGTTGVAKVNDLDLEFSVWVHLAVLRIEKEILVPRYVELALNSPHCYAQSQRYTQGISNFDLGLTRMVKITIPLPPLSEQRRIVSRVDVLMKLCDELDARIISGAEDSRQLLEAALNEALKPTAQGEVRELLPT